MRKKSLNIFTMGVINLMGKRTRTAVMFFFIALLSFTFFASSILMGSMKKGIENTEKRMGADLIVVPDQDSEKLQSSLFKGTPCTIYFERQWLETVQKTKGVKRATPQLYLTTMAASCCDAPVQLIAFDQETDFLIKPWLEKQGDITLDKGQIIVGSSITTAVGETSTYYNKEFEVAGKLEKSGMGYDNSVFMTFETAYELMNSGTASGNLKIENPRETISMILAEVEDDTTVGRTKVEIVSQDKEKRILVCSADELMSNIADSISQFTSYGTIITSLLYICVILALFSIFNITVNERKREFGILYTMGAGRRQIIGIILSEAWVLSIAGGIAGILAAGGIIAIFRNLLSVKLNIPYFNVTARDIAGMSGQCIILALVTGTIAAAYAVWKIGREEPYRLIRENES